MSSNNDDDRKKKVMAETDGEVNYVVVGLMKTMEEGGW